MPTAGVEPDMVVQRQQPQRPRRWCWISTEGTTHSLVYVNRVAVNIIPFLTWNLGMPQTSNVNTYLNSFIQRVLILTLLIIRSHAPITE